MTGKEAIAMLKRMQEPEAWEPQINEAAFEALEMAIEALEGKDTQEKDIIQQFHDYQVEWLKSHNDIYLDPQLEELIVHFLHDTANAYMMDMDR